MSQDQSDSETYAVFQKRVQDLVLDLAEAEARTHNHRFVDSPFRRKFFTGLESRIRRNKFLFTVARKIRG
jgi:hypothetical protein